MASDNGGTQESLEKNERRPLAERLKDYDDMYFGTASFTPPNKEKSLDFMTNGIEETNSNATANPNSTSDTGASDTGAVAGQTSSGHVNFIDASAKNYATYNIALESQNVPRFDKVEEKDRAEAEGEQSKPNNRERDITE